MKTSEILIEAKKNLSTDALDGNTKYVCFAIEDVGHRKGHKVIDRIESVLGTCMSVRHWLTTNGHATHQQCTYKAMQDYRHRWVDSLIAEYQQAGD